MFTSFYKGSSLIYLIYIYTLNADVKFYGQHIYTQQNIFGQSQVDSSHTNSWHHIRQFMRHHIFTHHWTSPDSTLHCTHHRHIIIQHITWAGHIWSSLQTQPH